MTTEENDGKATAYIRPDTAGRFTLTLANGEHIVEEVPGLGDNYEILYGGAIYGEDGNRAANIAIHVSRMDAPGEFRLITDAQGNYVHSGLTAGAYVLCIEYEGAIGLCREISVRFGRQLQSDFELKHFVGRPIQEESR